MIVAVVALLCLALLLSPGIFAMLTLLYLLLLTVPLLSDFLFVLLRLLPGLLIAGYFIGLGVLSWVINNAKGRDGGFWWGFFLAWIGILVVLLRPAIRTETPVRGESVPSYIENPGAWYCPQCGRSHAVYEYSCFCGTVKAEVRDGFDFVTFQPEARAEEPQ